MSCGAPAGDGLLIYVGNLLPEYIADATTCGMPFDFTGWTLTFEMRGPVTITGAATGTIDGVLTHNWVAGDTDIPGEYEVLFRGVSPSGRPRTFVVQGTVSIAEP